MYIYIYLCSKHIQEALGIIEEDPDVGVTVKGQYYAPGKEPKEEAERKLFLFIEATSELSLNRAKTEIVRMMKESMQQMVCCCCFTILLISSFYH